MKRLLLALHIVSLLNLVHGQDLSNLKKEKWLKSSGGLSFSQISYIGRPEQKPIILYLSGNLNLKVKAWDIPLSFNYSTNQVDFSQPVDFNQFYMAPSYKKFKAHIGYTSLSFSPYTLSGMVIVGGGASYKFSNNIEVTALGGRIRKPVEYNPLNPEQRPSYRRIGYGAQTKFQIKNIQAGIDFFAAKDDPNSIAPLPDSFRVNAEENYAMGINLSIPIKDFTLSTQTALSYFIPNILFSTKGKIYYATSWNLNTTINTTTVGVGYERVASNYQTLGAFFFVNDFENITLNFSQPFFQQKLQVSANGGLQRDNIDNTKATTLTRWVGGVQISATPIKKLSTSIQYSNFQAYTHIPDPLVDITAQTPFDNIDTLSFTQITNSATLNVNYVLKTSKKQSQTISTTISRQSASSDQSQAVETNSVFLNGNVSYSYSYKPANLSTSTAFSIADNRTGTMSTKLYTISLSVRKKLWDKLNSSLSTSFSKSTTSDLITIPLITNIRFNNSITLAEAHSFALNTSIAINKKTFTTITFNYNVNLDIWESKK